MPLPQGYRSEVESHHFAHHCTVYTLLSTCLAALGPVCAWVSIFSLLFSQHPDATVAASTHLFSFPSSVRPSYYSLAGLVIHLRPLSCELFIYFSLIFFLNCGT
jgi:hypothetical protein